MEYISHCFTDEFKKCITIVDGDRIKIKFTRMRKGQHYKFKYIDDKIYSAVYSGDGITLFRRREYMADPIDIEDPLYKKIKIPRGVAARRYTCIRCGKETLGWVHVTKRVCDECARKRENNRARRARSRRDYRKSYAREDVEEIAREIIKSYITNHPEPYQITHLHTKYVYEWGIEQKMAPSDLSLAVLKVSLSRIIPQFGYVVYRVPTSKCDRIFKKCVDTSNQTQGVVAGGVTVGDECT